MIRNYFSQRNTQLPMFPSSYVRYLVSKERYIYIYSRRVNALNRQIRTFDRVSSQVFEEI